MRINELGQAIRRARLARNLTQARLAEATGISRETMNLLESGLVRDLGIRKVLAVLDKLELSFAVEPVERHQRRSYVRMACTSASVSFKNVLTEDELVRALVTGKVPPERGAHLITLFDEAPVQLLRGLIEEAGRWTRPGKLQRNVERLARDVGARRGIESWMTTE